MSRKKNRRGGRHPAGVPRPVPRLRRHATGQAFARWRDAGRERCVYFGPWGSEKANAEYGRWAAKWATAGAPAPKPAASGVSVADLLARWLDWCETEYTKFGRPTTAAQQCRRTAQLLNAAHGDSLAADFSPQHLADLQRAWAAGGLSRPTVKIYRGCVVRAFRWAAGAGLLPAAVGAALREVPHLRPGRTDAAESVARTAVPAGVVDTTLPHLIPRVAAMVAVQRHTGMRPCEVCAIRPEDVSDVNGVKVYTVPAHANKTHHTGKVQWYALGPKAWAALAPHLDGAEPGRAVFRIGPDGYGAAIRRACVRAGAPHWTPHQLRHSYATEAARVTGSYAGAAAAIGDTVSVARGYVHTDPQAATKIALAQQLG